MKRNLDKLKRLKVINMYLTNKNLIFAITVSILVIFNLILSYYTIKFLQAMVYSLKIGEDTGIFLQKVWNGIHGRLFVSSEKFGYGAHHWDITIILLFGPLLIIFQNPYIIIYSTIVLLWTSIVIFFIFYISLKGEKFRDRILISLLVSLVYIFNLTIIANTFTPNYYSSYLFPFLYTLSLLFFLKGKYRIAGTLMILSYMVNLETLPYFTLLFFIPIILIFGKNISHSEKKAIYKFMVITVIYIVIFHFILYQYLVGIPNENVFSFYYSIRYKNSNNSNPLATFVHNIEEFSPKKIEYIMDTLLFMPPFSLNPIDIFNILMCISVNKTFITTYLYPNTHYHIPNVLFTILFLWAFLYYNNPIKKHLYIVYVSILFTLVFELPLSLQYITHSLTIANNALQNQNFLEVWKELNFLRKTLIRPNESLTTSPTLGFLFYKEKFTLSFLASAIDPNTCNIVDRFLDHTLLHCEGGNIATYTYYYLIPKSGDKAIISYNFHRACDKKILIHNLEKEGYRLIYEGKYFLLFRIKNSSRAYYGCPILDLSKILRFKSR